MPKNFWQNLPQNFTILAPMEGVTDVVFRQVVAKAGRPDVFFTEFTNVSSYASEKGRHDALERLDTAPNEAPIVAQIWGKNPEHFAKTAAALEKLNFSGLDINMGCPDKHVNKAGGGAAMIKTPELAIECLNCAKNATSLPVSVKTRLGFAYINEYKDWISLLLQQNLAVLTVHLRTRKEMSKVPAHYELIPEIIRLRDEISPETKLIINGDIKDLSDVHILSQKYHGVDGFMIGRGVFQNPFCFKPANDHDAASATNSYQPSKEDLLGLLNYHLDLFDARQKELEARGSRYPFEPLKHFFKIYINHFDGSKDLRTRLMECATTAEVREILSK